MFFVFFLSVHGIFLHLSPKPRDWLLPVTFSSAPHSAFVLFVIKVLRGAEIFALMSPMLDQATIFDQNSRRRNVVGDVCLVLVTRPGRTSSDLLVFLSRVCG